MKFTVIGADRDTGEDIEMVLDASTPEEASAKANRRGLLVTKCAPENAGKMPDVTPTATSNQPAMKPTAVSAKPGTTEKARRVLSEMTKREDSGINQLKRVLRQMFKRLVVFSISAVVTIAVGVLAFRIFISFQANTPDPVVPEDPELATRRLTHSIKVVDAVTGAEDNSIKFSNWAVAGWTIKGNAVWEGAGRLGDIVYTVRQGETVVARGGVIVPGGVMRRGEPVEVNLDVMREIKPDMEIVIEIGH